MGKLTTHVLDTSLGKPAGGLHIELWKLSSNPTLIKKATTNSDGRVDAPLLSETEIQTGEYELRFDAGGYLKTSGASLTSPPFLSIIPIRFAIADASQHYHVPLLLSAHGYSTYRGS